MKFRYQLIFFLLFTYIMGSSQNDCYIKYSKGSKNEIKAIIDSLKNTVVESDTNSIICFRRLQSKYQDLLFESNYNKLHQDSSIYFLEDLLEYLGKSNDHSRAILHSSLSTKYNNQKKLEEFFNHTQEASTLYLKLSGDTSSTYIATLNSLGYYYSQKGNYILARKTLERARNNKERKGQNKDMQYARIINQLGDVYLKFGSLEKAENCFTNSIAIKVKSGSDKTDLAKTFFNYAKLLAEKGQVDESIKYLTDVISIFKKGINNNDDKNSAKEMLALLYQKKGDNKSAIGIFKETITERAKSKKDSNYPKALLSLSELFFKESLIDSALVYCENSIKYFDELEGQASLNYALSLRQKAIILAKKDIVREAVGLHKKSIVIIEKSMSKKDINYITGKVEYLHSLYAIGDLQECKNIINEINENYKSLIVSSAKSVTRSELGTLSIQYKKYFHFILNLLSSDPLDFELMEIAVNNSIFYKSFILQTILQIQKKIKLSHELSELTEEIKQYKFQINENNISGISDLNKNREFVQKKEESEVRFNKILNMMDDEAKIVEYKSFQDIILDNESLIDFISYEDIRTQSNKYVAFIITRENLFLTKLFDECIYNDYILKVGNSTELIDLLYDNKSRGSKPLEIEAIKLKDSLNLSLFKNIWKPLQPFLKGINKIYYMCDGILHNLSLQAIPLSSTESVIDSFDLIQVTSLGQIRANDNYDIKIDSLLLIGDLEYGNRVDTSLNDRGKRAEWSYLKYTANEINSISIASRKSKKHAVMIKGISATKKNIYQNIKNKSIIHFASHGFFGLDKYMMKSSNFDKDNVLNVMMNSGIVLSNANTEESDGYLTAEEISEWDLSNASLVTLSACETGLGRIYENEGVYGLKRALKIAGTNYIIMSLWKVDDAKTSNYMQYFYHQLLIEKRNIVDAFNITQRYFKGLYVNPKEWAGFVLIK